MSPASSPIDIGWHFPPWSPPTSGSDPTAPPRRARSGSVPGRLPAQQRPQPGQPRPELALEAAVRGGVVPAVGQRVGCVLLLHHAPRVVVRVPVALPVAVPGGAR